MAILVAWLNDKLTKISRLMGCGEIVCGINKVGYPPHQGVCVCVCVLIKKKKSWRMIKMSSRWTLNKAVSLEVKDWAVRGSQQCWFQTPLSRNSALLCSRFGTTSHCVPFFHSLCPSAPLPSQITLPVQTVHEVTDHFIPPWKQTSAASIWFLKILGKEDINQSAEFNYWHILLNANVKHSVLDWDFV